MRTSLSIGTWLHSIRFSKFKDTTTQYQWQFFKPARAAIHFTRSDGFQILVELIKHFFLLNREMRSEARKGDESRNWFLCFLHENCIIYEGKVLLLGACRCSCRKATKVWKFLSFTKRCYRGIWISVRKVIKSWNNSAESIDLQAALGVSFFLCHMINNCRSVNSPLSSLHECLINDKPT